MIKSTNWNGKGTSKYGKAMAVATVAAALAGTLSMVASLPALAEEQAPDQG